MSFQLHCRDHDLTFGDHSSALKHLMKEQHDGGHDGRIHAARTMLSAKEPLWWICNNCDPSQWEYGAWKMWQHLQECHQEIVECFSMPDSEGGSTQAEYVQSSGP
ncbi:hypothetical protein N7466_003129 [Penicillium verhagenii]|uniref:uncharacterized protein n=1 Tax=Penicillium verhagenii TaxID=1562060 RepID=UPI0025452509|nr:uncharacterized protein N7466_003129 [Penicillium verhagenii]KAJ5936679.1 hypothetical protein N7466_003129 [Penicillium verhagenii]